MTTKRLDFHFPKDLLKHPLRLNSPTSSPGSTPVPTSLSSSTVGAWEIIKEASGSSAKFLKAPAFKTTSCNPYLHWPRQPPTSRPRAKGIGRMSRKRDTFTSLRPQDRNCGSWSRIHLRIAIRSRSMEMRVRSMVRGRGC